MSWKLVWNPHRYLRSGGRNGTHATHGIQVFAYSESSSYPSHVEIQSLTHRGITASGSAICIPISELDAAIDILLEAKRSLSVME